MKFDHIFDHRQTRSTRKQRNTERRRAYKTEQKAPKIEARSGNYAPSVVGVVEAAGSSPVTQTRKSPMTACLSDFFVFSFFGKMYLVQRWCNDSKGTFLPRVKASVNNSGKKAREMRIKNGKYKQKIKRKLMQDVDSTCFSYL